MKKSIVTVENVYGLDPMPETWLIRYLKDGYIKEQVIDGKIIVSFHKYENGNKSKKGQNPSQS